MQFQTPFDAHQVEPASFAPPPPMADYHVRITESEAKPTADQSGGYLELTLEILDPGPYVGRKVPYRLNLYNKSQQTVEIAYRQLSAVCHVTNVFQVQDSRQLHNIPFIATIGPQKDNPQYANVFGVKDLSGAIPGKPGAAAPAAPFAQPAAPAAAPAAPAWSAPSAPAAPAAPPAQPAWQQPPQAAAPAAAPVWSPGPPAAAPAAPGAAPSWQQNGASPAVPPWQR